MNTDIMEISLKEFSPAFKKNNIAIALAANDYFVPYMVTLLQSILENSNLDNNYDILVLTQDISQINRTRIIAPFKKQPNFSVRFIDPTPLIAGYNFYMRGHFSLETYYRLVLPDLLPNYKKVLYLDSDMVVQADVAQLFDENIDDFLLAACHDADTAGLYNGYEPGKKAYTDNILKLKDPYQYFQAGVIIFNLEKFRKVYNTNDILKFAVSEKWELLDQDVLNKLCEGQVKFINMEWNVMVDFGGIRQSKIIALAPKWLNTMYIEARKAPKIIHYAGPEKPWFYPEMDQGVLFWNYARKTLFYETMLSRMCTNWYKVFESEKANELPQKHSLVKGFTQCINDHGLLYTLKYLPERLVSIKGKV